MAKPRRPKVSQTERVLRAIQAGETTAATAAKRAKVPVKAAYVYIYRLRERGLIKGKTGSLRATKRSEA